MPSRKLIPRSAVEQMTRGSLEQTISRVREAVRATKTFGEAAGRPHLVATFQGYALVGTESGKFFRVKVEESENGSVHLIAPESYPVQVYENTVALAEQKLDEAFDAILRGESGASRRLAEAAELITLDTLHPADQAKRVMAALEDKQRPWRSIFRSHRSEMRKFIESAMPAIRARLPQNVSKFSPLYSGTTLPAQFEDYGKVVRADLGVFSGRLAALATGLSEGYTSFCANEAKFRAAEEAAVVESFRKFAEDFIEDVASMSEAISELTRAEGAVPELGLACDTVAAKMEDFELAAAFIDKTLKRAKESAAA